MSKLQLPGKQLDKIIDLALAEDTSFGDITSEVLIPPNLVGKASMLIEEEGVLAGGEVAGRIFQRVDPTLKVASLIQDGTRVNRGDITAVISGRVTGILKVERTALNFLQRLSGTASLTAQYVAQVQGTKAIIIDTRKTTPGLRALEKYAVRMGGGKNHRLHLGDRILIKDNHLTAMRALGMSLKDIVTKAKQNAPRKIMVEAEVATIPEALEAVEAGSDIIMLDNMSVKEMRQAVNSVAGRAKIEASGGITLTNIREVAMTGVDFISVGALTHSLKALNISLEFEPQTFELL
ncbi:carboxylating nicotinate-nucleotide diphosphorylase [Chloroflexota bacterium]